MTVFHLIAAFPATEHSPLTVQPTIEMLLLVLLLLLLRASRRYVTSTGPKQAAWRTRNKIGDHYSGKLKTEIEIHKHYLVVDPVALVNLLLWKSLRVLCKFLVAA